MSENENVKNATSTEFHDAARDSRRAEFLRSKGVSEEIIAETLALK